MNYKNEYDHYWSQEDRFGEKSFESEDSLAQDIISAVGYGKILDIGSGMGDLVISLLHHGVDAMGLDVSSIAVNSANKKASGRFIEGSVLSLPFEDNSFETIISTDCLEHLSPEDVVIALREIYRVCKKSIYFIIAITQDRENHYYLTVENRAWWEQRFYEAGFRKHPSYYEANNYESLQNDSWQIKIVLEKIPLEVLKNYPLEILIEERDLHTDMTREVGERSDAHIHRYFEAAKYIRYGDTVLDAACGLGYGSSLLYHNSLASKVIGIDGSKYGIDYATMNFGLEQSVVFQEGYLPDALHLIADNSIDFIVSFETLEHVEKPLELLAEFHRILTPGGRIFVSVPNDWADETGEDPNPFHLHVYTWEKIKLQLEQYFDIELSFAQSATRCKNEKTNFKDWRMCKREWTPVINKGTNNSLIECEWIIMCGIKNPNMSNVKYRETVFPFNNQDNNVIAFERDYENPWLIRSMVSIGMRSNDKNLLIQYANEVLSKNLNVFSADYGAALCVLVYQLLEQKQLDIIVEYIVKIENYINNNVVNSNQYRWQVSLTYFLAIYHKDLGNFDKALFYFTKCGNYDVSSYHPSLGTKVVDSLYWAGLLTNNFQNDYSNSAYFWKKGINEAFKLLSSNSELIYDSLDNPLIFAIDEMEVILDIGRKCSNALYAKSFNSRDGYFAKFIQNSRISRILKLEKEIKSFDYLNKSLNIKDQWIEELQKGKDWIESQNRILEESVAERQNWIDELQKGKDWVESQNRILEESVAEKQKWIDELQKGKDWLEEQYNILKEQVGCK